MHAKINNIYITITSLARTASAVIKINKDIRLSIYDICGTDKTLTISYANDICDYIYISYMQHLLPS